eukprot:338641_1
MGNWLNSSVQTFFPDTTDPYLVLVVRCKIVTETISIPINLLLLILFHYLYQKYKEKINKRQSKKQSHKGCISNNTTVILTYLLLIFGFIFSILQGLLENFALNNCADIINTYFEFFFYIGHRTLLLLIYLNRLFVVFSGSAYRYPIYIYYIFLTLIIISGILSFISHSFNLSVLKVPSGWDLWNDDDNVCAWQFGPFVTHVTRPLDYILNFAILSLFLSKLYTLHATVRKIREQEKTENSQLQMSVTSPNGTTNKLKVFPKSSGGDVSMHSKTESMDTSTNTNPNANSMSSKRRRIKRRREHSDLEIIARRMSILTFIAIISSIIVTGGYLGYSIRIIGALWPFDLILNSYCCILMFRFTGFMVDPCFGKKCDRCCCIKYIGCCDCQIIGKCVTYEEDDDEIQRSGTDVSRTGTGDNIENGDTKNVDVDGSNYH